MSNVFTYNQIIPSRINELCVLNNFFCLCIRKPISLKSTFNQGAAKTLLCCGLFENRTGSILSCVTQIGHLKDGRLLRFIKASKLSGKILDGGIGTINFLISIVDFKIFSFNSLCFSKLEIS